MTAVLAWFSYPISERKVHFFFRYIVSGSVVLAVLTLFLPKVAEINKISEVYTSPTLGLNSHNQNRIEVFGDKKAVDKKILLIGDSHALSIKPFLNYIGQKIISHLPQ